jgi:dTDP-4-dehydrorhamnose 3,5-epimerase-like enzyme
VESELPEVPAIEPDVHRDDRGFLPGTYKGQHYSAYSIDGSFVQDNPSRSVAGAIIAVTPV